MMVRIYWKTRKQDTRERITEKFNLPHYTTVNGETEGRISEEDFPLLKECEKMGYIQIRKVWE